MKYFQEYRPEFVSPPGYIFILLTALRNFLLVIIDKEDFLLPYLLDNLQKVFAVAISAIIHTIILLFTVTITIIILTVPSHFDIKVID